ncbi:MAG: Rieske 2Fe-2S domain-containing protein [Meiothermus sp.]|nr:Rieske 2Fe-2S domain-containing protein [Meiothermus sp.]
MAEITRRNALGIIAIGTLGLGVEGKSQSVPAVKIADLSRLAKEWDSAPFDFGGTRSLLVRVAKPDAETRRVMEVKQGDGSVWLTAYTLVCTHEGCTPAMPNARRLLECPCHGSAFKAQDGTVANGPAREALRGIRLEVREGAVFATGFVE